MQSSYVFILIFTLLPALGRANDQGGQHAVEISPSGAVHDLGEANPGSQRPFMRSAHPHISETATTMKGDHPLTTETAAMMTEGDVEGKPGLVLLPEPRSSKNEVLAPTLHLDAAHDEEMYKTLTIPSNPTENAVAAYAPDIILSVDNSTEVMLAAMHAVHDNLTCVDSQEHMRTTIHAFHKAKGEGEEADKQMVAALIAFNGHYAVSGKDAAESSGLPFSVADLAFRTFDILMGLAGTVPSDYPYGCVCNADGKCSDGHVTCMGRAGSLNGARNTNGELHIMTWSVVACMGWIMAAAPGHHA